MIREIEFRGMCAATNEWVYGLPSTETTLSNSITHISQFCGEKRKFGRTNVLIKPETLGQFTGVCDKNGKRIYHADLVRYYKPNSYADGKDILEVRWHEQEVGFKYWCLRMKDWECAFQKKLYNIGNNKNGAWCEIIGDIYSNPELLEKYAN